MRYRLADMSGPQQWPAYCQLNAQQFQNGRMAIDACYHTLPREVANFYPSPQGRYGPYFAGINKPGLERD